VRLVTAVAAVVGYDLFVRVPGSLADDVGVLLALGLVAGGVKAGVTAADSLLATTPSRRSRSTTTRSRRCDCADLPSRSHANQPTAPLRTRFAVVTPRSRVHHAEGFYSPGVTFQAP
jgi:hypothetical protein